MNNQKNCQQQIKIEKQKKKHACIRHEGVHFEYQRFKSHTTKEVSSTIYHKKLQLESARKKTFQKKGCVAYCCYSVSLIFLRQPG